MKLHCFGKIGGSLGQLLAGFGLLICLASPAALADFSEPKDLFIQRGAAVDLVVKELRLKNLHAKFIAQCLETPGECYFSFLARSGFREISVAPLQLYPDVRPGSSFYEAINVATALDMVIGYQGLKNGPFRPWSAISRIEAVKLILTGMEKVKWDDQLSDLEWQERYLQAALDSGMINAEEARLPSQLLRKSEFDKMLEKAKSVAK